MGIWFTKITLLLIIMVWLYGVWHAFSTGLSSWAIACVVIFCVIFSMARAMPKQWKHMKQIEALRRNQGAAALYGMQFETDETKCSLPITLSTHPSHMATVLIAGLWCAIGALISGGAKPGNPAVFWGALIRVVFGALSFGPIVSLKYQRIEATQQGLVVQRGWKRRFIPWDEAKLFAALRLLGPENMPTQYEISSTQTLLR
jgi:hypothetical protein